MQSFSHLISLTLNLMIAEKKIKFRLRRLLNSRLLNIAKIGMIFFSRQSTAQENQLKVFAWECFMVKASLSSKMPSPNIGQNLRKMARLTLEYAMCSDTKVVWLGLRKPFPLIKMLTRKISRKINWVNSLKNKNYIFLNGPRLSTIPKAEE